MLEWTGERYLPWIKDAAIAYEHLHRYVLASRMAAGKRVLDLASGEGYGAHLLASTAQSVVGIEIDASAVEHARQKYNRANLEFLIGSITSVPISEDKSFDVVVCFEAIEHIDAHEALLSEIKRLLNPDGLLLVSTPNKHVYQTSSEEENPFHVHELEFEEFRSLLLRFFKNAGFLGQRIQAVSAVWPTAGGNHWVEESIITRNSSLEMAEFEFVENNGREPIYFISVASDAALPTLTGSVLIDASDQLLKDKDHQIHELFNNVGELLETKASNEKAIAWKDSELKEAAGTINSHEQAIEWLQGVTSRLEAERTELQTTVRNLSSTLSQTQKELDLIQASRGWQWILRLRKVRAMLGGKH
jgi:O-antigen biosynthesis protein